FGNASPRTHAQDLVIDNVRILDGAGTIIERGAIEIRAGRIRRVGSGPARERYDARIDGTGLTALPGFIDAHRHIVPVDSTEWLEQQAPQRMREFLEAGFTTVMSGG